MLNILIPMAGESKFFSEAMFPKSLYEIKGKPMIQILVSYFSQIKTPKKFIFVVNQAECEKYHLDKTLKLLAPDCEIVLQTGKSNGAACSSLLAIEYINNDTALIISNFDQFFDVEVNELLGPLTSSNADGGIVCFESVHPQWSFAKTDANGNVVQTAEKVPISKNAIAGIYYFRRGADFVKSAMKMIMNDSNVNGSYYNSQVYNELILEGKSIKLVKIPVEKYHSFYSIDRIKEFESHHVKAKV
jgi:dTDP-glucose pyrophosphorylase